MTRRATKLVEARLKPLVKELIMETVTTAASTDETPAPETTEEVVLVEEVSIDGMCGVY